MEVKHHDNRLNNYALDDIPLAWVLMIYVFFRICYVYLVY